MFKILRPSYKTGPCLLALTLVCLTGFGGLLGGCTSVRASGQSDINIGGTISMQESEAAGQNSFSRGSAMKTGPEAVIQHQGQNVPARTVLAHDNGLLLPDGRGGLVLVPGQAPPAQNPNYADARELKLKMRELASQLVAGLDGAYSSYVALPTAFVTQDDFERSSSLGRFIAEQMYYEFNQRGLPTREYRQVGQLAQREDGEFILKRQPGSSGLDARTLYLVGTYYTDGFSIFVNARLIRHDGRVVRTGQLVMPSTPLARRMIASSSKRLAAESLEIKDFESEARLPESASVYDY